MRPADLVPSGTELETVLRGAWEARRTLASMGRSERARVLEGIAEALDSRGSELVALAREESHLTEGRLSGELTRTTFQLRLFAEVVREGAYLDVRVDHADPQWGMGPRPDIRRIHVPMGPVLVFAAGNFPFAFSVAGGDVASALAAGCPVIVKAHPGHPRLSQQTAEVVSSAIEDSGAPDGTFGIVYGLEEGRRAVVDPRIKACGFTGSIAGGRALFDLATSRSDPIPFYAEMGSINPVFVTPAAASNRADEIAEGFVASFTLGAGQFCTKPGILVVPADSPLTVALNEAKLPPSAEMLDERIQQQYVKSVRELAQQASVQLVIASERGTAKKPAPSLFLTTARRFLDDVEELSRERFGPTALVVTYEKPAEALDVARALPGQLTATVHGDAAEPVAVQLVDVVTDFAGRVLWNQWPTGVSVSHAQQHGGPYPATTVSASTSVGTAAIARFLRPVAYQNVPVDLLPAELGDDAGVPRLVDGRLDPGAGV